MVSQDLLFAIILWCWTEQQNKMNVRAKLVERDCDLAKCQESAMELAKSLDVINSSL